jgi:hypothetical protein
MAKALEAMGKRPLLINPTNPVPRDRVFPGGSVPGGVLPPDRGPIAPPLQTAPPMGAPLRGPGLGDLR